MNRIEKWDEVHGSAEQNQMQDFLESPGDSYAILQLRSGDEMHYERWSSLRELDSMGLTPDFDHYELVYSGPLPAYDNRNDLLENFYYQFNMDRPEDFHGHSLSVSDVVAIKENNAVSFHFVDSFGFKELQDFLPENYLKNAEMALEDDYDMIDGTLNNGISERASVLEKLREEEEKAREQRQTASRNKNREMER